ncbi:MAG: tRNA guanosine(15) transglycosylase TgtA, partial [Methanotrichaceae archaeon]|nr:tRNA guanosine(15) transglycosylase TgtA [Methanotrichaceae archaeon]
MRDCFEILHKDLAGRIGRLTTLHGSVETPALMPVINPHLQFIPPSELTRIGARIIITNSYIIWQDEILRNHAIEKGLHDLIGFQGPIMTDSGAYQLSVFGHIDVEPLEILSFQQAIHSDISVPLDIPTPPYVPRERAEIELMETKRRLLEALEHKSAGLLAGPIQGSTFPDLRERAASFLKDKDFDVYPIGGVVPLMESYRFKDLVDVVASSKKGLGSGVPVHLFGAGHPMMFSLAVAMGCDLFDSAAYALYARQGRYLTSRGTWNLEKMKYLPCSCQICQNHTAQEIIESPERTNLVARHNLYVSFQEMRLVKQAICEGSLWDLLESRCRSHPKMIDALRKFGVGGEWIERLDTSSKSTLFYLGPESCLRPEVLSYGRRIERLSFKGNVIITDDLKTNLKSFDQVLHFKPPFGPYPIELGETFPFNAEVPEEPDQSAIDNSLINMHRL